MFGWEKTVVCDGVVVFQKESTKKESAILITIPKAVIKSAVTRNNIRRRAREVFRKNTSKEDGIDFLVKFNSCPDNFDSKLEEFFKNV
tara:strand:- start:115 stop:378 length:264 start_codon:yes stop_codon:yes gene_type:complete